MILVVAVALAALSVPICGGSLGNLSRLRAKAVWTVLLALLIQVVIISVVPKEMKGWPGQALELTTYALAVAFLIVNRRVPWLWVVGLGGLSNLLAIGANDGVMPASSVALRAAGRAVHKGQFMNSTSLQSPHLTFLGDNFSIPRHWPFANVFSIGDVILLVGATLLLHSVCGTRPARAAHQWAARSIGLQIGEFLRHQRPTTRVPSSGEAPT